MYLVGGFLNEKETNHFFRIYFKNNHPAYIVGVSYPEIKKAGSLQTNKGRTRYESSTNIKSKQKPKNNIKSKK